MSRKHTISRLVTGMAFGISGLAFAVFLGRLVLEPTGTWASSQHYFWSDVWNSLFMVTCLGASLSLGSVILERKPSHRKWALAALVADAGLLLWLRYTT